VLLWCSDLSKVSELDVLLIGNHGKSVRAAVVILSVHVEFFFGGVYLALSSRELLINWTILCNTNFAYRDGE
jgi:hypothetical protein